MSIKKQNRKRSFKHRTDLQLLPCGLVDVGEHFRILLRKLGIVEEK